MFQRCRTCLQEIQNSNFFTLTNNSAVSIIIKNQLALCVPEIIPDVVSDPVMCYSCVTALHSAFDFRYRCLQTEERIRNFIQSHRQNSNTTSINLPEMFTNIYGADTVGIAENLQLTSLETLLDIKCETLSIHENEIDLAAIDPLQDSFVEDDAHVENDARQENHAHQLPEDTITYSPNPEEIYTLEKLCISEELQLHFNCMFVEQSRRADTTHVENDVFQNLVNLRNACPVNPSNSTGGGSYNLEDWNRFEDIFQGVIYTREAFHCVEDESEEENPVCYNATSSYSSKQPHLNKRTSRIFKENKGNKSRGKRPKLVDSAKYKKTNAPNPENSLKYKRTYKKRKLIKPVKIRKSKRIKKLFKCNECGYTTKFLINLELHSISHIEIDEDEVHMESDAEQCSGTSYGGKNSKYNRGYKYVRYDYTKKQKSAVDKRNCIEKKKSVQPECSKSKLKKTWKGTKSHKVLENDCMEKDNQFDQYKQSASISETVDKFLRINENRRSITNKFSKHNLPAAAHNTDNREDDEQKHLATESMKNNEVGESSHEKNNCTVKEETLNKDKDKEKKHLKKENQFSKSHNLQDCDSNDQYRENVNRKNAASESGTGKYQPSNTGCITKKLKDCQIEKDTGSEQSKANRSSDSNPNEISADSKYNQFLNNECVIINTFKLGVVAENEHQNDDGNTLKCNDHIEDSVDADQIDQNKSNVNIQSSAEAHPSNTDCITKKLIDCQIEKETGSEQSKANRSSDSNPNEISADSNQHNQPLNNECVINNTSKLGVVAENEQHNNDGGNTLKCNDHIEDPVDADQIEQNKSNVNIQSSAEEQPSNTDCITKKLKDCQIEKDTGSEQSKANRSSGSNPNEISADSKYNQSLNNECVIINTYKLGVVAENEQHKNDGGNTLKCNDDIEDSVDDDQIGQNKSNVNIQSSAEAVQSLSNDNAKNKLNDEKSQLHNNETNTCIRNNYTEGNNTENIFIEANQLLKSHHSDKTAKDQTFSKMEAPEENRLEESTVKNHTEDDIEENHSRKEEDSFKSDLVDKAKLLPIDNGNQSNENTSCKKSKQSDSASDKNSTKNSKNVCKNQCLSVSSDYIDEKQSFENIKDRSSQNGYGGTHIEKLCTAVKTNKTHIDGYEEKEIGESSCCTEKLRTICAKRKLQSHDDNKKFFKSDCGSGQLSNISGTETTASKCSGSSHSEFCGCIGHKVAATFKKDLADKMKLLLTKKDSVDRTVDAELYLEVP